MAFDLIVINIPELGYGISVPRHLLYKILYDAGAVFDSGTTLAARRTADEYVISLPKVCDYIPAWITKEEKLARMRRGWRPYYAPVIAPPVLPVWHHFKMSSENIGSRNFKREIRK